MSRILRVLKTKIRRFVNQLGSTKVFVSKGIVEKYGNNPVLGDKTTGTLFDPCVIKHEDVYRKFVSRRENNDVALYESLNGVDWEYVDVALNPSLHDKWDKIVNRVSVLKLDETTWYMWYTGQNKNESAIGFATSVDGVHFSRYMDDPVIVPRYSQGEEAAMNPCVIRQDSCYVMFYAAGENYEPDYICQARSCDGIEWKIEEGSIFKADPMRPFEQYKVGGGCVLRHGAYLYLFYIGYKNLDVAHICVARSIDGGTNWLRAKHPIIVPSKNEWDCHAVYKAHVCLEENRLLLWYNGRRNKEEYIGFAICDDFAKLDELFVSEDEPSRTV